MHDLCLLMYFTCSFIHRIYQKSTHINAFLLLLKQTLCMYIFIVILIDFIYIYLFVLLLHVCTGSQI